MEDGPLDAVTEPIGGVFLTLEGPDGSGKTTQAARLAAALRAGGHVVCLTREPGGTPVGERIRDVLLASPGAQHVPLADALLFSAARAQLVADVIRPALSRGEVVVCDRFADSTLAYQGYGSGADLGELRALERIATGGLRPHLTVLLDLPVDVGLGRRRRGPAADVSRFEAGTAFDAAFHERVRAGFLELARAEPARWRILDAAQPADAVAAGVLEVARELLSRPPVAPLGAPRLQAGSP